MARQKRSLADAFNQFEEVEPEVKEEAKVEKKEMPKRASKPKVSSVKKDVQKSVTVKQPEGADEVKAQVEMESKSLRDVSANIMAMYDEKAKRKTMEETHKRASFLFRRDLQDRLDALAADKKRGFKTLFLNQAIEALLNEMEDYEEE